MTVNGRKEVCVVEPGATLLELLREILRLTGTKEGCGKGECGACTVLVDGAPVDACLMLAAQAAGREVTTIEGLAKDGLLHPVQQAFVLEAGVQCGFCTPGLVVSAVALLARHRRPTEAQVRRGLEGNLCRCTGYTKVVRAVGRAARVLDGGGGADD